MRSTLFAAALATVLLAGCQGAPASRATAALGAACGTIGRVAGALAPLRAAGRLAPRTVRVVDAIRAATADYCDPASDVDPAAVVAFVEAAAARIAAIAGETGT